MTSEGTTTDNQKLKAEIALVRDDLAELKAYVHKTLKVMVEETRLGIDRKLQAVVDQYEGKGKKK